MATAKRDRRRIPGAANMPTQCNATNRFGAPCRRPPVLGATVCATHGSRAPQVRAAADRRISDAAVQEHLDATLARMNLDAPPIADPAAAMANLAGRLLSGFEGVQSRLNECREQGRVPNDVDIAERALWVKELRSLLTDMTRLQVGVQLASRYMPDGKAPGGDLTAEQDAVVSVDLPDVKSIVEAVMRTEHALETDRLVKVEQAKAQGQLPAGLQVVAGVVEPEAESA